MVCGSNTPSEKAPTSSPWRLSALPTQCTLGSVRSTFSKKQFVLTLLRSTSAGSSRYPSQHFRRSLAQAHAMTSRHRLDLSTNSRSIRSASNVKTHDVTFSLVHHAHLTINLHCAAHSEKLCKPCDLWNTEFPQRLVQFSWHMSTLTL